VTSATAAEGGQLAVLQWLRRQEPPCPWDEMTCTAAAEGGQLAVLQWLWGQDPPCPWIAKTCYAAAEHGHLQVLQWARARGCPWDEAVAYKRAAHAGQLEVLRWTRPQQRGGVSGGAAQRFVTCFRVFF
jgi:hypothetical protein